MGLFSLLSQLISTGQQWFLNINGIEVSKKVNPETNSKLCRKNSGLQAKH
jgi:hypothetical protein